MKRIAIYIDSAYLNNSAYAWGIDNGIKRCKFDYRQFLNAMNDMGEVLCSKVYFTKSYGSAIGFKKWLNKNGYIWHDVDDHLGITGQLTSDLLKWSSSTLRPDVVVIVSGNGRLLSTCRAISDSTEIQFCSFIGSTARSILHSDFHWSDASNYIFAA